MTHPPTAVVQQHVTTPPPAPIRVPTKPKEQKPEVAAQQPADTQTSTPTDNSNSFPDTPPPDATPKGNGGSSAPTDPASQPLGGTEPVQVQGIPQPSGSQQTTGTDPGSAPTGTTGP